MENKIQTISVRVEPDLKIEAENILKELGMSTSTLFTLLLKQVVINKGIPFQIKLEKQTSHGDLTINDIKHRIKKGIKDIKNGDVETIEEVERSLRKKYNLNKTKNR